MGSGVLAATIQLVANGLSYPLYLHLFGYKHLGLWLTLATIITITQFGIAGTAPAVTQLVADAAGRGKLSLVTSYATWAFLAALLLTLILFIPTVICRNYIARWLTAPEASATVAVLAPAIVLVAGYIYWVDTYGAVLAGLGRQDLTNLAAAIGQLLTVTFAFILGTAGWGLFSILIATFLSKLVLHLYLATSISRLLNRRLFSLSSATKETLAPMGRIAGAILGGAFLNVLLMPFSKIAIARYASLNLVPFYEIAWGVGMQGRNLMEAGLRAIMPEISRLAAQNVSTALLRISALYRKAELLSALVGALFFSTLAIFAPFILSRWLGASYNPLQVPMLRILLVGAYASLTGATAYHVLVGLSEARAVTISYAIHAITNLVLVVVATNYQRPLSPLSVAAATSVGLTLSATYLILSARRALGARQRTATRVLAEAASIS